MWKTLIGVFASYLAAIVPAYAADNPLQADFILDVGWFLLSTDLRVRVDGETTAAIGSDIDFEETFGMDDADRFRADAMWRFAGRHAITAMYFQNNRSGAREMSRDIHFGDEVFPVGANVSAKSHLTVAQLSYDYAFLQRPNYELAGGIGLHMLDINLNLNTLIASSGNAVNRSISEEASTQAPLPVFGLRGLWRLSDKFYASLQAQYFYIELDRYKGSLSDLKAQIVWQCLPHLGIGIGYNDFSFRFKIDDDSGHFNGRLRTGYAGAMAFASVTF